MLTLIKEPYQTIPLISTQHSTASLPTPTAALWRQHLTSSLDHFWGAPEGLQNGREEEKQTPWKSTISPCNPTLFLLQHAQVTVTTWLWFFVCLKHSLGQIKNYGSALRKDLEHHELPHWESQLHQPAAHWSSATDKTQPTTLRLCSPQLPPCHCQ